MREINVVAGCNARDRRTGSGGRNAMYSTYPRLSISIVITINAVPLLTNEAVSINLALV